MEKIGSVSDILLALKNTYGEVETFLYHQTDFQLLIAVILSAQTTDALINKITPALFAKYPDAKTMMHAPLTDIEILIGKVNYYKTKSKHIIAASKMLVEHYQGNIPNTIQELILLPGVGRKVANVILSEIHHIPEGIVVDTHVKRVANRIGWTKSTNPVSIERDLMSIIPIDSYINLSKQLILIGRQYCHPKTPNCNNCPLHDWCEKIY